ncbi:hypothetical protein FGB62_1g018 [Gracilaria domingensis]|nr:hypothetical protein FGB62_1g018 [Gracilaria domingensis]
MSATAFVLATPVQSVQRTLVDGATRCKRLPRVKTMPAARSKAARLSIKARLPSESKPLASDEKNWVDVLSEAGWSLAGVYFALSGIPAAFAVPDALKEAFKTKPASLVHPVLMWALLGTCLYTFYLGYQSSLIRKSEPEKRKELIKKKVTDNHFRTSSSLFAVMTLATFGGMANTYTRTGKLFPGPHLYAGLGLVALFSVTAAFVPYMQKGKEWARQVHFSLAFVAVGLFGWQAKSGMVIVGKLLGWD